MNLVGKRVKLVFTSNPHTALRPGALGRVGYVDGIGTIHVQWDSGSNLGLIPDVDRWEVLPDEPTPAA